MKHLLILNGGASIRDGRSAFLSFPDVAAVFRRQNINTGDILVYDAILKVIRDYHITNIQFGDANKRQLWPKEMPDLCIIRGSNYLIEGLDLENVVPLLEHLKCPIVAMGVGAQSGQSSKLKLSSGSVRFWKIVSEKSASLGVRGAFTAEVLGELGINNVEIIGCPSFYRSLQPSLSFKKPTFSSSLRTGVTLNRHLNGAYTKNRYKTMAAHRRLIQESVVKTQATIFAQGEREETVLSVSRDTKEQEALVTKILSNYGIWTKNQKIANVFKSSVGFLDVDEWSKFAQHNIDWMIGFRLHGNVIALHQGIPAVFFSYDTRLAEIIEFFQLPHLDVGDLEPFQIEQIFEASDFGPFENRYRRNYGIYRDFLNRNNVNNHLVSPEPPKAARGENEKPAHPPIELTHSAQMLKKWYHSHIDQLSTENEQLRSRLWRLQKKNNDMNQG